jgi:hypothetical protein
MSEDRLDMALEGMKNENVNPGDLAAVRARVWEKLENPGAAACAEFELEFHLYLDGRQTEKRRLLTEDHLSRCPHCRARLAELKGERKVVAMPQRRVSRWTHWGAWAAAAAVVFVALYLGRDRVDTMLTPGGPRFTVASTSGTLHRLPAGMLQAGAAVGDGETIRTGPGGRAVLRLSDGSLIDVNERTELFVRAAWSGQTIHLRHGDVIVQAAEQRRGNLRVQTRDSLASVKGTVFAVSAGIGGTVVSVVEGSVAVRQPGVDVVLSPGQQAASNPVLAASVREAVSWSPDADKYIELLASVSKLEKEIAALPGSVRTEPSVLKYLPPNTVLYGAVPNLGGTIGRAMDLAAEQAAANPVFNEWWNSDTGNELRRLVDRVQTLTPLLGDEVVFAFSKGAAGATAGIPVVMAEIREGKRADLAQAVEALRSEIGGDPLPYSLADTLIVVSDSDAHLQWVIENLGGGASSPFAAAVAARYERGAGWLLGLDMESGISMIPDDEPAALLEAQQMKNLFVEQRSVGGVEENEVSLTFKGPRMGMAAWLASSGSGGAAEYLSSEAAFALYMSTREPRQLFDELTAQVAKARPEALGDLAEAESKLGISFASDVAAAMGTESAFALEGFSVSGPVWVLAVLVNDPKTLDSSITKLIDVFNAELPADAQDKRLVLTQETADGREWKTLKPGFAPLSATWTYDNGYMVAASDRAAALRAIATRNDGMPLVLSSAFHAQLPGADALHPSGFCWINTKGALQDFAELAPSPALRQLLVERDPILVVFNATTEQISASSRTRISGLMVDAMLLESLGRSQAAQQPATVSRKL